MSTVKSWPWRAENQDVIDVGGGPILHRGHHLVCDSLEGVRCPVEPKRHLGEVIEFRRRDKCCLLAVLQARGNLSVSFGEVSSGQEAGLFYQF